MVSGARTGVGVSGGHVGANPAIVPVGATGVDHGGPRCIALGMASQRHVAASHASWGNTVDRAARTERARQASPSSLAHWIAKLDPVKFADASDAQKNDAAVSMRKAHFASLAAKSVKARNAKRATP